MDSAAATAPLAVQAGITNTVHIQTGADPMVVRWGISSVIRDKYVDPVHAGFAVLPFGTFFPVNRFTTPLEIHTTDDNMPKEQLVTKTALSAELYLKEMLAGYDDNGNKIGNKTDLGLRIGFYGEMDTAKMAVISATLLPSLTAIRQLAAQYGVPSPIAAQCEGHENFDVDGRESCPSCWSKWIGSEACTKHIEFTATNGRSVQEYGAGSEPTPRTVYPSIENLQEGREIVIESLKAGLRTQTQQWQVIAQELAKGERKGISIHQEAMRQDLHAPKPADREVNMIREFGQAAQGGASGGNNDALMALLVQGQAQQGELLARMAAMFAPTAQAPVAPTDVPAAVPVETEPVTTAESPKDASPSLSPAAKQMEAAKKNKEK